MKLSKARSRFLDILNLSTETPEDEMPDVTKESLDKFHAAHEKVISEKEQLGIELGNLQKQIGEMNATNEELNAKVTGAEKSRDEWKKKYEDAFNADEPGKDGTDTIEQEDDDDSEILTSVDAEVAGWEKK